MAFEDAPSPQQRRPERSVPTAAAPRHAPAAPGSTPGSSEPAAGRSRAVPVLAGRPEVSPSATAGTAGRDPAPRGPAPGDTAGRESARGEAAGGPPTAADSGEGGPRRPFPRIPERDERDSLTLEELANEGGVDASLLRQLEQFGLLTAVATVGGAAYYDEDALTLARVAAGFAQHGVEARHLRAWRHAAEREASLFEQIVLPLLRQRNPQSRQQAADTLMELSDLGADLRRLLVRQALRHVH
ncbi:MAG: MerR family transcriptional regulator [Acidimicrobiales bacterium]